MAQIMSKVVVDIKIGEYGYFGPYDPTKHIEEKDLSLGEEHTHKNLTVKEAIKKLLDYVSNQ